MMAKNFILWPAWGISYSGLLSVWSHGFLTPCYSNMVHRPTVSASPGNLLELQTLLSGLPDLVNQHMHLRKSLGDLFETLQCKKHCSTKGVLESSGKLFSFFFFFFPTEVERMMQQILWVFLSPSFKNFTSYSTNILSPPPFTIFRYTYHIHLAPSTLHSPLLHLECISEYPGRMFKQVYFEKKFSRNFKTTEHLLSFRDDILLTSKIISLNLGDF